MSRLSRKTKAELITEIKLQQDQIATQRELLASKEEEIRRLRAGLRTANKISEEYFDTIESLEAMLTDLTRRLDKALADKERAKKAEAAAREDAQRCSRALQTGRTRDREKIKALQRENEELRQRHTEQEEQIAELKMRLSKDYTNSSTPSSRNPSHAKIANSREKTGRRAGGQQGHPHHGRKILQAQKTVHIEPPPEFLDGSRYTPTGRTIRKQKVSLRLFAETTEYVTPEFRVRKTGRLVHAKFPEGLSDDVTFDGSVKAFLYMLNNECNVSIKKTKTFLKEITDGQLDVSEGMICKLTREFAQKSKKEREQIFADLCESPTMHVDFTFGRLNGKLAIILICSSGYAVLYQAKEKKGFEGIKGSPAELFEGIIISDHEAAFLKLGVLHQECLAHILRYLRLVEENEPEKRWSGRMRALIQEMIHYWNGLSEPKTADPQTVAGFERRFGECLQTAREEYAGSPPKKYFREGINLAERMSEKTEDYLLFLNNPIVEPTNNEAERKARQFKEKAAEAVLF